MNLPHQKPILFAKKVIKKEEKNALVECVFDFIPSFGMGLEASAQASASLADGFKEGFLAGANSVKMMKKFDKTNFLVKVVKEFEADGMELFSFELEDYMRGKFAIYAK